MCVGSKREIFVKGVSSNKSLFLVIISKMPYIEFLSCFEIYDFFFFLWKFEFV